MTWRTPNYEGGHLWAAESDNGYYRIGHGAPFIAYHVEALWARPVEIGQSVTLDLAKQVCEYHSRGALATA